ncbi:MAG: chemotaxis protein CheW [Oligoflexia bacterium]
MSKDEDLEYITFQVEDQLLGIPVHEVREVLPEQPVARVPLASAALAGLLNLRGQIVTAIDVRKRLGIDPQPPGVERMNIVIGDDGELFSLLVDSVGDVRTVNQAAFAPAPSTLPENWKKICSGVYRLTRGLLVAVDVASLVNLETQTRNERESHAHES